MSCELVVVLGVEGQSGENSCALYLSGQQIGLCEMHHMHECSSVKHARAVVIIIRKVVQNHRTISQGDCDRVTC